MQITFRKPREGDSGHLEVRANRRCVAKIAFSDKPHRRHYWYLLDRHPDEPPHNTLHVPGSATTFEGCIAEVKSYFANRSPKAKGKRQ